MGVNDIKFQIEGFEGKILAKFGIQNLRHIFFFKLA